MRRVSLLAALIAASAAASIARADYPVVDMVAAKVVQKYQTSSCDQLKQEKAQQKGQPKSDTEQHAVQLLHEDAGARSEFFGKVSAPIVQKLFECGMIP